MRVGAPNASRARRRSSSAVRLVRCDADVHDRVLFLRVSVERPLLLCRPPSARASAPAVAAPVDFVASTLPNRPTEHRPPHGVLRPQLRILDAVLAQHGQHRIPNDVDGRELHPGVEKHHLVKWLVPFNEHEQHGGAVLSPRDRGDVASTAHHASPPSASGSALLSFESDRHRDIINMRMALSSSTSLVSPSGGKMLCFCRNASYSTSSSSA